MASRDLRSEVVDLVAHQCRLPRRTVQLSDRLLHDLGIEGDDAVDFFNSVDPLRTSTIGANCSRMDLAWIAVGLIGFGMLAEGLLHGRMLNVGHNAGRQQNPRSFWFLAASYALIGGAGAIYALAPLL